MSQEQLRPVRVGLLGIGTVGSGTFTVLKRNQEEIRRRAGRGIEIAMVADLNTELAQKVVGDAAQIVSDARAVIANPDIDVVVELIGGYGIAKALVLEAIAAGKHVVTANKALLAVHGTEIFAAARAKGVIVAFEAAVAGGIPIIKALREGLTANQIQWVAGIINGTTNFILSEMRDKGLDFDVVLKEAQRLGYAEADPTFDIEGVDAAHKATLLSAIAFGIPVQFDKAHVEGITRLSATDIKYAEQLGYRIKLLGIASRTDHGIEQRVHPCMVKQSTPIAHVDGVFNAVVAEGDCVGRSIYEGRCAGAGPTASAVAADIVDIARGNKVPTFGVPVSALKTEAPAAMDRRFGAYYLRLMVLDKPGVLADVANALRDENISVEQMIQPGRKPGEVVPMVMTLHETEEAAMNRAAARIAKFEAVVEPPRFIRIENL